MHHCHETIGPSDSCFAKSRWLLLNWSLNFPISIQLWWTSDAAVERARRIYLAFRENSPQSRQVRVSRSRPRHVGFTSPFLYVFFFSRQIYAGRVVRLPLFLRTSIDYWQTGLSTSLSIIEIPGQFETRRNLGLYVFSTFDVSSPRVKLRFDQALG